MGHIILDAIPHRATIADLKRVKGKAELINGRIVVFEPDGGLPGQVKLQIARNLADHVDTLGKGIVGIGSLGYVVPILKSGRESFCADVSYYSGPLPTDPWAFIGGAPEFAVEVMNHTDFYPGAERDMAAKRADYFEAGTKVVWDVDPLAKTVTVYTGESEGGRSFGVGEEADAGEVLPGWKLSLIWLFR